MFGSGGSILAVPILVYIFAIEPATATLYSLFIVGSTSFIGALDNFKNKLINFKLVLFFGIPSIIGVLIARKIILPIMPKNLFIIDGFIITKSMFLMIFFAILMIIAAYSMIKKGIENIIPNLQLEKPNFILIFVQGFFVGLLTGLLGAGGGFLIIPALVLLTKLPIKNAVGTSLVIISLNSLIGFSSAIGTDNIKWSFLFNFLSFSIVGILIGIKLSHKINSDKLKPLIGYFIMFMGVFVIIKELFLK